MTPKAGEACSTQDGLVGKAGKNEQAIPTLVDQGVKLLTREINLHISMRTATERMNDSWPRFSRRTRRILSRGILPDRNGFGRDGFRCGGNFGERGRGLRDLLSDADIREVVTYTREAFR